MFRDQASPNCGRSAAWRDIRAARLANAWARVNMGVNLGQGARRRNTYPLVAGSVPPIYTKGGTLTYLQVMAGEPRREAVFGCAFWWGSAGPVLCAQGSSREGKLSRFARGECLLASNACSGPLPLCCARHGVGLTYLHKRGHCFMFLGDGRRVPKGSIFAARCLVGLRGTGPARARKLWKGWSFRAVREGRV